MAFNGTSTLSTLAYACRRVLFTLSNETDGAGGTFVGPVRFRDTL
ncbi:hypothetical protein CORAM0001_0539 [Corynebacterium amycolatum SK46]|nr:hypothetical protein CORAM0001_0539 [Corynebacterium amycolatum SK46]